MLAGCEILFTLGSDRNAQQLVATVTPDRLVVTYKPLAPFEFAAFADQQAKTLSLAGVDGDRAGYLLLEHNAVIDDLGAWAQTKLNVSPSDDAAAQAQSFNNVAEQAWQHYLDDVKPVQKGAVVSLDFGPNGEQLGAVVAEIHTHVHRRLGHAVLDLLQAADGYTGSAVDHVVADGWIQLGDIGTQNALRDAVPSSSTLLSHSKRGVLSVINNSKVEGNGEDLPHRLLTDGEAQLSNSTIFLSLAPLPDFDARQQYTVIGRVLDGWSTLCALERLPVDNYQRVLQKVTVTAVHVLRSAKETSPTDAYPSTPQEEMAPSHKQQQQQQHHPVAHDPAARTAATLPVEPAPRPRQEYPIAVGDQVYVGGNPAMSGTVRYVGTTSFRDGVWVGIELSAAGTGKNDGSVDGVSYFTCAPKSGVFAALDKVSKRSPSPRSRASSSPATTSFLKRPEIVVSREGKDVPADAQPPVSTGNSRSRLQRKLSLDRATPPTTADIQLSSTQPSRLSHKSDRKRSANIAAAPTPANSLSNVRQRVSSGIPSKQQDGAALKRNNSGVRPKQQQPQTQAQPQPPSPSASRRLAPGSTTPNGHKSLSRKNSVDEAKTAGTKGISAMRLPSSMKKSDSSSSSTSSPTGGVNKTTSQSRSTSGASGTLKPQSTPSKSRTGSAASANGLADKTPPPARRSRPAPTALADAKDSKKQVSAAELLTAHLPRPDQGARDRGQRRSTAPSGVLPGHGGLTPPRDEITYTTASSAVSSEPRTPTSAVSATSTTNNSPSVLASESSFRKLQMRNEILEAENDLVKVELTQERARLEAAKLVEARLSKQIAQLMGEQKRGETANKKLQALSNKFMQIEQENLELRDVVEQSHSELEGIITGLRGEVEQLNQQIKDKDASIAMLNDRLQNQPPQLPSPGSHAEQQPDTSTLASGGNVNEAELARLHKDLDDMTFALEASHSRTRQLETELSNKQKIVVEIDEKLADTQQEVVSLTNKLSELELEQSNETQTLAAHVQALSSANHALAAELKQAGDKQKTLVLEIEELHQEVDRLLKANQEHGHKQNESVVPSPADQEQIKALTDRVQHLQRQLDETVHNEQDSARQREEEVQSFFRGTQQHSVAADTCFPQLVRLINDKKKMETMYESRMAEAEQQRQKLVSRLTELEKQLSDAQAHVEEAQRDAQTALERARDEVLKQTEERTTNLDNLVKLKDFELKDAQRQVQQLHATHQKTLHDKDDQMRQLTSEVAIMHKRCEETAADMQALNDEIGKLSAEQAASAQALADMTNAKEASEKEVVRILNEAEQTHKLVEDEFNDRLSKASAELASAKNERDRVARELVAAQAECAALVQLREEHAKLESTIAGLGQQLEEAKQASGQAEARAQQTQAELGQLREQLDASQNDLGHTKKALEDAHNALADTREQLSAAQLRINTQAEKAVEVAVHDPEAHIGSKVEGDSAIADVTAEASISSTAQELLS
ncbi:hypothetical protein RI367_001222 [Sorochytrium milnesiophthora]